MSEFKGTQGEWGVCGTSDCISIENNNAESICAINSTSFSKEEYQANAKLISCAPEMLEMLKDVLSGMNNENFEITRDEIEQLIKKATE